MMSAAMASRILWYAMALCFFLRVLDGIVVLSITLLLSPSKMLGPATFNPNDLKVNRTSSIISVACFPATISDQYVELSTVFCRLQKNRNGVPFRKINIPVIDLHDILSLAWSASI